MVGLENLMGGLPEVVKVLVRLANFDDGGDSQDKDIIEPQPGVIALAVKISKDNNLQRIMNNAKEFYNDSVVTDEQSAAILTLATEFTGGDYNKVKDIFNDMSSKYNDTSTALTLALASVIDGYDSDRIKDMYDYTSSYTSADLASISDQAATIVLATAAQEAIDQGKLPPVLEQAVSNVNILPLIFIYWFFFSPISPIHIGGDDDNP